MQIKLTKVLKKYLNVGILVKESHKCLHKMKEEIDTAK